MNQLTLVISDTVIHQDATGHYSLNDFHKAAGDEPKHKPANFLRLDNTKALIDEIDRFSDLRSVNVINGNNPGTYAVKEIIYAYAMWISPAFSLKVIRTFDALMTGLLPSTQGPITLDQYCERNQAIKTAQLDLQNAQIVITAADLAALKITPAFLAEIKSPSSKPNNNQLIVQMVKAGNTRAEIVARLDVSHNSVRQAIFHARRNGLLKNNEGIA